MERHAEGMREARRKFLGWTQCVLFERANGLDRAWHRSRKGELCQIVRLPAALQPLAKRDLLRHGTSSKQTATSAALGSHGLVVVVFLAQIIAQSTFQ